MMVMWDVEYGFLPVDPVQGERKGMILISRLFVIITQNPELDDDHDVQNKLDELDCIYDADTEEMLYRSSKVQGPLQLTLQFLVSSAEAIPGW